MTGGGDMGLQGDDGTMDARRRIAMALGQPPAPRAPRPPGMAASPTMMPDPAIAPPGGGAQANGGSFQPQNYSGSDGGDIADRSGQGRDQRSFGSFSEMINNPDFQGDWGKVGAMLSPGISFARDMLTGTDPIAGGAPLGGGAGMAAMGGAGPAAANAMDQMSLDQDPNSFSGGSPSLAGLDLSPAGLDAAEAAGQAGDPTMGGGGGGVNAADLGAEANAPGMFSKGGFIGADDLSGPDPAGPDQGFIGARKGEVVLNKGQQKKAGLRNIAQALAGK